VPSFSSGVNALRSRHQCLSQEHIKQLAAAAISSGKARFQLIAQRHQLIYLGNDALLLGKTIEREDGSTVELTTAIDKKRRIDTAYEIYLGLYQAITGPEDRQKLFREFSPGFFDLIVIDECHRGSAAEDSAWREILDYFSGATQVGLTATPKETKYVSNIDYFGPPVYSYSLKQGIRDGFLAPYKVIKVHIDRDVGGYRPEKGQLDRLGEEVEDRIYNTKDFDRTLVLDDRTKQVARKVTEFLKESDDRFQKTIVFCVDQEHAARMRQALVNENSDLVGENNRYVMRILRWSILQHYEICATPLLDVTQSLRVAASFASERTTAEAFIFVLGVPNLSGAVTANAETGIQIVRLTSVCPPNAKRPHVQEGYLLGEYPELSDYSQKRLYAHHEVDFGKRLVAKFRFDPKSFWKERGLAPVESFAMAAPNGRKSLTMV
jgi:hypothetical protein